MPSDAPTLPEPTDDLIRVRRAPQRGTTDRAAIDDILDSGVLCHLGYLHEGRPVVVPTLYGRDGDAIVVHGSPASRAIRAGAASLPVCATVTVLDGLVLARSAFHHSAAYRSVVVHGEAELVTDDDAKLHALQVLSDQVAPGRWDGGTRLPNEREMRATSVLRLPLTHAVAKARGGHVNDDDEDLDRQVWAGLVPVSTTFGAPQPDGETVGGTAPVWAGTLPGVPVAPQLVAASAAAPR